MTRISFYVLTRQSTDERFIAACRIAEKAYQQGHGVYLHTESPIAAERVDQLLWTFRQGSFVPHVRHEHDDQTSPVVIGHDSRPQPRVHDVMINLTREVPLFFGQFERLVELVADDDQDRQSGRERFRFYRDRGYALETLNLPPQKRA
ncbi:MAG: DNA polymerase III subunit chi [Pseudomonadota bacterium]|nr:DNA polymerase III subunit chi [Pseudomonadota bacterium]